MKSNVCVFKKSVADLNNILLENSIIVSVKLSKPWYVNDKSFLVNISKLFNADSLHLNNSKLNLH